MDESANAVEGIPLQLSAPVNQAEQFDEVVESEPFHRIEMEWKDLLAAGADDRFLVTRYRDAMIRESKRLHAAGESGAAGQLLGLAVALDAGRQLPMSKNSSIRKHLFELMHWEGKPTALVPGGSVWKYLDDGSDQKNSWRKLDYKDRDWKDGQAKLGYGDPAETVISYGSSDQDKHITTYFRHRFDVADLENVSVLLLDLLRDDGAVVYLNGREVVRSNMPDGPISHRTLALRITRQESAFHSYLISPSSLRAGTNLLAVEVHQSEPTSSDLGFDLKLSSLRQSPVAFLADIAEKHQADVRKLLPQAQRLFWEEALAFVVQGEPVDAGPIPEWMWERRFILLHPGEERRVFVDRRLQALKAQNAQELELAEKWMNR